MEVKKTNEQIGSLYISTGVIEKVAKLAAMEIDGVAEIDVNIVVKYGCKVTTVCKNVQEAVKANVQNMTDVAVSKVNIVVAGISADN